MMTARERAERALRHAPFMGAGKEAVLPLVEMEIAEAEWQERERCAREAYDLIVTMASRELANDVAAFIRNQEVSD